MRNHLKSTKGWTQNEETIIGPVIGKGGADLWVAGSRKTGDSGEIEDGEEKRYRSHYSVFDVGTDGAPLERKEVFLGTEMLLREDEGENGEGQENVGVGLGLKEEGSARRSGAGSQKGKEKERETVDVDRAVWMAIRVSLKTLLHFHISCCAVHSHQLSRMMSLPGFGRILNRPWFSFQLNV